MATSLRARLPLALCILSLRAQLGSGVPSSMSYSYSFSSSSTPCTDGCTSAVLAAIAADDYGTACHLDLSCLSGCGTKNDLYYAALCACDAGTLAGPTIDFLAGEPAGPYCCGSERCQDAITDYYVGINPGFASSIGPFMAGVCSDPGQSENCTASGTFVDCGAACGSSVVAAFEGALGGLRSAADNFCALNRSCLGDCAGGDALRYYDAYCGCGGATNWGLELEDYAAWDRGDFYSARAGSLYCCGGAACEAAIDAFYGGLVAEAGDPWVLGALADQCSAPGTTCAPTATPSFNPSAAPSPNPSAAPSPSPSAAPIPMPSAAPSPQPTLAPSTPPTSSPAPTAAPSAEDAATVSVVFSLTAATALPTADERAALLGQVANTTGVGVSAVKRLHVNSYANRRLGGAVIPLRALSGFTWAVSLDVVASLATVGSANPGAFALAVSASLGAPAFAARLAAALPTATLTAGSVSASVGATRKPSPLPSPRPSARPPPGPTPHPAAAPTGDDDGGDRGSGGGAATASSGGLVVGLAVSAAAVILVIAALARRYRTAAQERAKVAPEPGIGGGGGGGGNGGGGVRVVVVSPVERALAACGMSLLTSRRVAPTGDGARRGTGVGLQFDSDAARSFPASPDGLAASGLSVAQWGQPQREEQQRGQQQAQPGQQNKQPTDPVAGQPSYRRVGQREEAPSRAVHPSRPVQTTPQPPAQGFLRPAAAGETPDRLGSIPTVAPALAPALPALAPTLAPRALQPLAPLNSTLGLTLGSPLGSPLGFPLAPIGGRPIGAGGGGLLVPLSRAPLPALASPEPKKTKKKKKSRASDGRAASANSVDAAAAAEEATEKAAACDDGSEGGAGTPSAEGADAAACAASPSPSLVSVSASASRIGRRSLTGAIGKDVSAEDSDGEDYPM